MSNVIREICLDPLAIQGTPYSAPHTVYLHTMRCHTVHPIQYISIQRTAIQRIAIQHAAIQHTTIQCTTIQHTAIQHTAMYYTILVMDYEEMIDFAIGGVSHHHLYEFHLTANPIVSEDLIHTHLVCCTVLDPASQQEMTRSCRFYSSA